MEQPQAAEGHGDAVLVAGINDLLVTDGTAGLHDGGHAGAAGTLDVVAEGEEGKCDYISWSKPKKEEKKEE